MNKRIVKGPCKGFVVIGPECLSCSEPQNYHVMRAWITEYEDGSRIWSPYCHMTVCGKEVLDDGLTAKIKSFTFNSEVAKLRTYLSELQNEGKKVCGVCVSHFYADYQQEIDS